MLRAVRSTQRRPRWGWPLRRGSFRRRPGSCRAAGFCRRREPAPRRQRRRPVSPRGPRPSRRLPTPAALGLAFEAVECPGTGGLVRRGWFLPAARAGAAPVAPEGGVAEGAENVPAPCATGGVSPYTIIFAHGFRSNRLERGVPALELARSFVNACFHGLLFAFRNHGGS